MQEKPDCYKCKWRRDLTGDAHSKCIHPEVDQGPINLFAAMVGAIGGKNLAAQIKLKVRGDPHGIRNGWFLWPANYDPVWLLSCEGFEEKE